MSEDKRKICSLLLPVVQATRAGWDVIDLEYTDNEFMDDEYVRIRYASGCTKKVNVTLDSGAAMVLDVIKGLL